MFQSFNKNAGVWSCLQSLTSQGLVELSALNLAAWRSATTAIHPPGIVGRAAEQVEKYTEINLCNICESPPLVANKSHIVPIHLHRIVRKTDNMYSAVSDNRRGGVSNNSVRRELHGHLACGDKRTVDSTVS